MCAVGQFSFESNGEERMPLGTWAGGGGDRAPHETAVERCTESSRSGTNTLANKGIVLHYHMKI